MGRRKVARGRIKRSQPYGGGGVIPHPIGEELGKFGVNRMFLRVGEVNGGVGAVSNNEVLKKTEIH